MYAIIQTGGKQYKVAAGDTIRIEKLNGEVGDTVKVVTPGGTREFEIVKLLTIHDPGE